MTVARERGFRFLHINKLRIKVYWHLRYISISYYLKFPIPMCHRQFFKVISKNRDYVENSFCMSEMDQSIKLKIVCTFII